MCLCFSLLGDESSPVATFSNFYDFPAFCFGPVTLRERLQLDHDKKTPNPYMNSLMGQVKEVS